MEIVIKRWNALLFYVSLDVFFYVELLQSDLETLRGDLNTSLTETWKRDREIDIIQEDLMHTELENERLRNSLKQLADTDIVQRLVPFNRESR